jgi:hypothetical protein
MTPAETAIRAALAAGPTLRQEWHDSGDEVLVDMGSRTYLIATVEDWAEDTEPFARLIAACNPAALAELLAELDRLRAEQKALLADHERALAALNEYAQERKPLTDDEIDETFAQWFGDHGMQTPPGKATRVGFGRAVLKRQGITGD